MSPFRLGVVVNPWAGIGGATALKGSDGSAVRAEALGFVGAWLPYLPWAPDAMAAMQAAGEATSRIELGSAVIPTFFFHPLAMALGNLRLQMHEIRLNLPFRVLVSIQGQHRIFRRIRRGGLMRRSWRFRTRFRTR